jgi:hypothetical protein
VAFEILLKMKRNGWQREIYVKKENQDERYGWHTGILTVLMVVVKEKTSERITHHDTSNIKLDDTDQSSHRNRKNLVHVRLVSSR